MRDYLPAHDPRPYPRQMKEVIEQAIASLRSGVEQLRLDAETLGDATLYSATIPLKLVRLLAISRLPPSAIFWIRPNQQCLRIGLGVAWKSEDRRGGRFTRLRETFSAIVAHWHQESLGGVSAAPEAFCAFAFSDDSTMSGPWSGIPANLIMVPEVLLAIDGKRCSLTLSASHRELAEPLKQKTRWLDAAEELLHALLLPSAAPPVPDEIFRGAAEPGDEVWLEMVQHARRDIRQDELEKIVLARHIPLYSNHPFNAAGTLRRLVLHYPDCAVIGMRLREKTLVAATPERLAVLDQGLVRCDALAGTALQKKDPASTDPLVQDLQQDPKALHEHSLVVEHIRQALSKLCDPLSAPSAPTIMPLGYIEHLWTQVEACCGADTSLLDLAEQLHPTPAVAGIPADQATAWLARSEPFERGWYSGAIGWLKSNGDGELAVVLRCALLVGNRADLYAGAGIVDASSPLAELRETECKLDAIIGALYEPTPS
ncbi:MAG: isochorismate synthase [bacterium]|nr:isochorismate synthase [bacterium]